MSGAAEQHTAFTAQLAVKLPSRVNCVEAWRRPEPEAERALAGLQDGTLMILAPRDTDTAGGTDNARAAAAKPPEREAISGSEGGSTHGGSGGNGGGAWRIVQAFRSWGGNRSLAQLQVDMLCSTQSELQAPYTMPGWGVRLLSGACRLKQHLET